MTLAGLKTRRYDLKLKVFYNTIMQKGGSTLGFNLSEFFKGPSESTLKDNKRLYRRNFLTGMSLDLIS